MNSALTERELDPVIDVRVYPNPARNSFVVHLPQNSEASISIINGMGQVVSPSSVKQGDKHIFNSSQLSEGVYYVRIQHGNKTITKKLVII